MDREKVLQALYSYDVLKEQCVDLAYILFEENPSCPISFSNYVQDIIIHRGQLDSLISLSSHRWPANRMSIVDRNIMRIAAYELVILRNPFFKIVINDAIEMAKRFSSEQSSKFINGVLDKLYHDAISEDSFATDIYLEKIVA